jgi:hypothetical protein
MVVPVISRVSGIRATSRMMKGVARKALIRVPSTRLRVGAAKMAPRPVVTSTTARAMPANQTMAADTLTMVRVSRKAFHSALSMKSDIAQHLRPGEQPGLGQEACQPPLRRRGRH